MLAQDLSATLLKTHVRPDFKRQFLLFAEDDHEHSLPSPKRLRSNPSGPHTEHLEPYQNNHESRRQKQV